MQGAAAAGERASPAARSSPIASCSGARTLAAASVSARSVWNDASVHADDQVGEGVRAELAMFLREAVDGRPVKIAPSVCEGCGGRVFFVLVNASGAERECSGCDRRVFIMDSEEYWNEESWEDDEPGAAGCPCGSEEFEAAVAFSLGNDSSVRWVTMGLRCIKDGFCGDYADWKIDYGPTDHLLAMVQVCGATARMGCGS
ncbi:hypothetical protein ACFQ67_02015 [Streptomyces sp. NPDC056488]|uniref:hypothetical protein n=1 Tax=Streptomyces sp. NPDC056488 TaxID=3345836 RepID=UPI0036C27894